MTVTLSNDKAAAVDAKWLAELQAVLRYDAESGLFIWLVPMKNGQVKANSQAGYTNLSGYTVINFGGRLNYAHRLAWLFFYGHSPLGVIDHINGVRSDNRITNLRDVTIKVNCQNKRTAHSCSKSGVLGVSWHKQRNKWTARIRSGDKYLHLGLFDSIDAASNAYLAAKEKLHKGYVRHVV